MPLEHWNEHGPADEWMPLPCAPRGNTLVTPIFDGLSGARRVPPSRARKGDRGTTPRGAPAPKIKESMIVTRSRWWLWTY